MASKLPAPALALIEEQEPHLPPVAVLELGYLHEIGRARDPLATMLAALRRDLGIEVADTSTATLAEAAVDLTWTRDPFDRLIAAHSIVAGTPLVTADETILANLPLATWD